MMKKFIFILFSVLIINSCHDTSNKIEKTAKENNDTLCLNELKQANKDIANNKLVYCHYSGSIFHFDLRCENEMRDLLQQHNIGFKNEGDPCIVDENVNYNCYCQLMDEKIIEKYGQKFTDSLLYKADSLWVLKNLDLIFSNGGTDNNFDKCAIFPNDKYYNETYHTGLQDKFDSVVKYPKSYIKKSNIYSQAEIFLTVLVDRQGNATVKDSGVFFYDMETKKSNFNKNIHKQFEKIAINLVENTKWKPATIKGVNVNCEMDVKINLK